MSHTPHELAEEFPDQIEKMHKLRSSNAHFAKLYDAYHIANRAVHIAETDVKPASDDHMMALRKDRMRLKDEVYSFLSN